MIEFNNINFGYGKRTVLNDLSFSVPKGSLAVLNGESGSGKTTILRLLLDLETPKSGSIVLPKGTKFSAVFQENRLIPHRTVLENVALFSDVVTAQKLLKDFGLINELNSHVESLSGGMKRRVALARALAHPFDVLVLDEPFTGLDKNNVQLAVNIINRETKNKTVFLATHHKEEISLFEKDIVNIDL